MYTYEKCLLSVLPSLKVYYKKSNGSRINKWQKLLVVKVKLAKYFLYQNLRTDLQRVEYLIW